MTLNEFAKHLETSKKPGDAAVARYIRTHEGRIGAWIRQYGNGMSRAEREELLQVALLACVEATRSPDAETALKNVHNAMHRCARHEASWRARKSPLMSDEDETFKSNNTGKRES